SPPAFARGDRILRLEGQSSETHDRSAPCARSPRRQGRQSAPLRKRAFSGTSCVLGQSSCGKSRAYEKLSQACGSTREQNEAARVAEFWRLPSLARAVGDRVRSPGAPGVFGNRLRKSRKSGEW